MIMSYALSILAAHLFVLYLGVVAHSNYFQQMFVANVCVVLHPVSVNVGGAPSSAIMVVASIALMMAALH